MGKLFGSKTYLIGAMDRVEDHGAGWRDMMTPELHKLGVMVFNPLKKPLPEIAAIENDNNRQIRTEWKEARDYDKMDTVRQIRSTDLSMVDKADFIIVYIDTDVHACGTYEELFWANRCKKPVLVYCKQGKEKCPDWLFWTLPHRHIFSSWNGLLSHLDWVNEKGSDDTDRWILFDMEKELEAINRYRELRESTVG